MSPTPTSRTLPSIASRHPRAAGSTPASAAARSAPRSAEIDTAMALQADGKIVMAGGTVSDFVLARYNADGSLDAGFGAGGWSLTTSGTAPPTRRGGRDPGRRQDRRRRQRGGRAHRRTTSSPSTSRSRATTPTAASTPASAPAARSRPTSMAKPTALCGRDPARRQDRAWLAKSRSTPASGSLRRDFAVARYNANGSARHQLRQRIGKVTTDIGGATDIARNVVVQPDGAIVVSGRVC